MKRRILLVAMGVALAVTALALMNQGLIRQALFRQMLASMSEADRAEVYDRLASHAGTLWDTVPEPLVGRVAKKGIEVEHKGTTVRTNQAGFRSDVEFGRKNAGSYRIVCLGDSFVMGTGGPVEDRYADQLQAFFDDRALQIDGRDVEVLALGLGGWTMLQQVTYLTSRLTDYSPDLIAVLTVPNDITTSMGVTGLGTFTQGFSPEERGLGSGRFTDQAGQGFGNTDYTALSRSGCPTGEETWKRSLSGLERLTRLQHAAGGRMLLGILDWPVDDGVDLEQYDFTIQCRYWYRELKLSAPWYVTNYFPSPETCLPHDGHPNRYGHSLLATHLLHVLQRLEWIDAAEASLPPVHPDLSCDLSPAASREDYLRAVGMFRERLSANLDFVDPQKELSYSFLGGVLPDRDGGRVAPWGTVRTGFVLHGQDASVEFVRVTIDVPARAELFPFVLRGTCNGRQGVELMLISPEEAGEQELELGIPPGSDGLVEVILETESYFTTIRDARMRSYELLSASLE